MSERPRLRERWYTPVAAGTAMFALVGLGFGFAIKSGRADCAEWVGNHEGQVVRMVDPPCIGDFGRSEQSAPGDNRYEVGTREAYEAHFPASNELLAGGALLGGLGGAALTGVVMWSVAGRRETY